MIIAVRRHGAPAALPSRSLLWWMNVGLVRSGLYHLVVAEAVNLVAHYLFINTSENLEARCMSSGFEFLGSTAGFSIAWSVLPYEAGDSYLHVYLVGVVNTLAASLVAIGCTDRKSVV